jgi:hypothetical protein
MSDSMFDFPSLLQLPKYSQMQATEQVTERMVDHFRRLLNTKFQVQVMLVFYGGVVKHFQFYLL